VPFQILFSKIVELILCFVSTFVKLMTKTFRL